jgi:hypothetical protein
VNRRELLQVIGASSLLHACGNDRIDIPAGATYDDVLDVIHRNDVSLGEGLSNHAPMAAEALVALGAIDRVAPFVSSYATDLPAFVDDAPLPAEQRTLGDLEQRFAWIAAFALELETGSPAQIATRELPRLMPGWAAVHGLLRIGHALRALEREDTPSRRRELAFGLGYAAAGYHVLPGVPGARPQAGLDVVAALAAVPLVPDGERRDGLILERFAVLEGRAAFVDAVEAVDLDALPIDAAIGELTAAAARLFVAHGSSSIVYLHAITGTSLLRLFAPYLDAAAQRAALGDAFQAAAAAHAVTASAPGVPISAPTGGYLIAELVERASRTIDEHRIKLTEACLREHAITARPELLAAAGGY